MAEYHVFTPGQPLTVSVLGLNHALRALDATAGAAIVAGTGTVKVKKETAWTAPDIAATQIAIDTATEPPPAARAQRAIDQWPIEYRALVLALIDALNVLRQHPAIGLPAITPVQALAAIRTKAGQL